MIGEGRSLKRKFCVNVNHLWLGSGIIAFDIRRIAVITMQDEINNNAH